VDVSQYESDGKLSFVDMFALGVERLAESYPMEQPEQIVDSTMKFSDLIAQGRSFTLKHLGKKTMGIMDSLTPFFLMVEAKKVFQYGQVLKYATRFAKSIGIATLHTHVLDETIENAMVNFADIVLDMEKRKGEGPSHGGTLRLVKMGKTAPASRGYYYEMTENGIDISTAPMI
jgi:archaellum biogenesis ATPase FlaH